MRVFLFDQYSDGEVRSICSRFGVQLSELNALEHTGKETEAITYFLDKVDAIIVEMTEPKETIHFLLAQAILANKPTLCLYKKNMPPRHIVQYIRSRKTPRPMKTFSYSSSTLQPAVYQFLRTYNPDGMGKEDHPSIKYTLRLTPKIDRYLHWAGTQQGKTKADVIRALLTGQAEDDEDYTDASMSDQLEQQE